MFDVLLMLWVNWPVVNKFKFKFVKKKIPPPD